MPVGRLLREISSSELTEWIAIYQLEAEERAQVNKPPALKGKDALAEFRERFKGRLANKDAPRVKRKAKLK